MNITVNKGIWLFFCLFLIIGGSCKNQQKIAEEQAAIAKAENIAQAKSILNSILNDDGQMTLAEKEQKLRQARVLNSDDPEVQQLIAQVEEMLSRERESQTPAPEPPKKDPAAEETLADLFNKIAGAGNTDAANALIEEGLDMFTSPQALVLIIISKSGDLKDYDEPTTIHRYLNYLKDQGSSPNTVFDIVKDGSGKISELELIKKSNR